MATNYPTSLDDFTNTIATETLLTAGGGTGLSSMLNNLNDSIEALEAKVGIDSSAVTTSHDYKLTKVLVDHDANGKHKIIVLDAERYATDSVGTDAYAITLSPVPTAYATGMMVNFVPNVSNTGACTINVNSLGAKNIKYLGQDPADNMIMAAFPAQLLYDGTSFQLINPATRELGFAKAEANQGSITTAVDLTSLSVTFNAPGIVPVVVEAEGFMRSSQANDRLGIQLLESSTQLNSGQTGADVVSQDYKVKFTTRVIPSAGSHTYKLQGSCTGGGTGQLSAASTFPAFIQVRLA